MRMMWNGRTGRMLVKKPKCAERFSSSRRETSGAERVCTLYELTNGHLSNFDLMVKFIFSFAHSNYKHVSCGGVGHVWPGYIATVLFKSKIMIQPVPVCRSVTPRSGLLL